MVTKITNITIMDNGNVSPSSVIKLGNKYENVKDALVFTVPWTNRHEYSCYLAFKLIDKKKKTDTILLPVNWIKNATDDEYKLTFFITTNITKNVGTYEIVFLASSNANLKNLEDATEDEIILISNEFYGEISDNFLTNKVDLTDLDKVDENIEILHGNMVALYNVLNERKETDYYKGNYFVPSIDEESGIITWTLVEGNKEVELPEPTNIRGPQGIQGPYYVPGELGADGKMEWGKSQENMDDIDPLNFDPVVSRHVQANLYTEDDNGQTVIDKAVDAKFKFTWNPDTKTLYIETEDLETIPEKSEGVKF